MSIEQNLLGYFLSIQSINRGHLAAVAWSDCQKFMSARVFLFVCRMQGKNYEAFSITKKDDIVI